MLVDEHGNVIVRVFWCLRRSVDSRESNLTYSSLAPSPPSISSCVLAAGQRHLPDPGSQEPHERRGPDRQGLLRGLHQVPEGVRHGGRQLARGVLAHEGAREEAAGETGEARRVPDARQTRLAEETHLPRPGPERIQGHGLLLRKSTKKQNKTTRRRHKLTKTPFLHCVNPPLFAPCVLGDTSAGPSHLLNCHTAAPTKAPPRQATHSRHTSQTIYRSYCSFTRESQNVTQTHCQKRSR